MDVDRGLCVACKGYYHALNMYYCWRKSHCVLILLQAGGGGGLGGPKTPLGPRLHRV